MKRLLNTSPTSLMQRVVLHDSSSAVGARLAGLAYNTASLAIAIAKDGAAGADALTIEDITTIGTYQAPTSSAHIRFKAVDGTDFPGLYEIHYHNDTVAALAGWILDIRGATNLAPVSLEVQSGPVAANVTQVAGTTQTATDIATDLDALAAQVGSIGTTGAAAYQAAASVTLNGSAETLTFAATDTPNGTYHEIADNAGAMNVFYEYTLRPDEVAVGVVFKGRMTGAGDNVAMRAYDWVGAAWVTLATLTGVATTTDVTLTPALVGKYTGTGANVGKVRIGFYAASGLTSASLKVDQCIIAKANTSLSIGYANGSIWVKATGASGTVVGYNGTADNPCPWADALTLNAVLGLNRYTVAPGTAIALDATDLVGAVMMGRSYSLALDGQNISGSYFEGVEGLSGTGTCAAGEAIIVDSHLNAVTIGEADFVRCHLMNTVTMAQNSVPYRFHDCTGITGAKIVFTGDAQAAVVSKASGALTIAGMQAGDTLYIDGNCSLTLDDTNTGGTVHISGAVELTNAGSGQTITKGGVTLGNWAHGGDAATYQTAAGVLAQETTPLTLDGVPTSAQIRRMIVEFSREYLSLYGIDGAQADPLTCVFSVGGVAQPTLAEGQYLDVMHYDVVAGQSVLMYRLTDAGWTKGASFTSLLDKLKVLQFCGGFAAPATSFPAGTLVITRNNAEVYEGEDFPEITVPGHANTTGAAPCYFVMPDGLPSIEEGGGVMITDANVAAVDTAAIAVAVRDVPQLAIPVAGSLGADIAEATAVDVNAIANAVLAALNSQTGLATEASVTAIAAQIAAVLATGSVASSPAPGTVSNRTIGQFLEELRVMLRDRAANAYKPELMLALYNRAIEEISLLLMRLGADVASSIVTILGDGVHQDYELPGDFRAFEPNQLRPRSPATATENFTHGRPLEHTDQIGVMTTLATTVGTPSKFKIVVGTGGAQYLRFDVIPKAGIYYDGLYYLTAPRCASVTAADQDRMPWLGLLDQLIARTMELYLREGLEYTLEARELWRQRAAADCVTLLGLRHFQSRGINPSAFRGLGGK